MHAKLLFDQASEHPALALPGITDADVAGPGSAGTLILAARRAPQIRERYALWL
ncbi:MAG TPA: hypothetical protein VGX72_14145 [Solirubrobacteraceae bacterium]|nr:hypothetical protein [Solirubrobacteraceae bacterium]